MIRRLLIANRGEIAVRIIHTARRLGVETVVVVSDADRESMAARLADRAVCVGPARATDSYLRHEAILATALHYECDAVHPGYGFLAEDADFAEKCIEAGVKFVGPSPRMLRMFGDKVSARAAAKDAGIAVGQGSEPLLDADEAAACAEAIGYPVMMKATKGGGGKGMRVARSRAELLNTFPLASAEALASFGDGSVFLETWVQHARHVEVQIVASPAGEVIHLGDRDCSVQRRHQKLVEEAPAPLLPYDVQESIRQSAIMLARHVGFDGVGTVEFLYDPEQGEYFFLEVNPRIQVEHGVSELVTGMDIVELQLRIAANGRFSLSQDDVTIEGAAIECRINAEDPRRGFLASPGRITALQLGAGKGVRVDTHCEEGYFIPPYYDSLIAKVMVCAPDRTRAVEAMLDALADVRVVGVATTTDLGAWIVDSGDFRAMRVFTRWLDEHCRDGVWNTAAEHAGKVS